MELQVRSVIEYRDQLEHLPVGTIMVDTENGDSYRVGLLNFCKAIFSQSRIGSEISPPIYITDARENFIPMKVVWRPDEV